MRHSNLPGVQPRPAHKRLLVGSSPPATPVDHRNGPAIKVRCVVSPMVLDRGRLNHGRAILQNLHRFVDEPCYCQRLHGQVAGPEQHECPNDADRHGNDRSGRNSRPGFRAWPMIQPSPVSEIAVVDIKENGTSPISANTIADRQHQPPPPKHRKNHGSEPGGHQRRQPRSEPLCRPHSA